MIVKINPAGKSFKGLSDYLTHDTDADTKDRLAWSHMHNLANDDVPGAVNEMVWTARDAELLKQEAGVRAGGREAEYSVTHASLSWSPEEKPTQEHMIKTSEDFLKKMKWDEHQAIMIAHNDKPHAHVHLIINRIHPETGQVLNDSFEHKRAQDWALQYEKEQGRIYCEQRLLNPNEREKNPPRNIWMAFQENEKQFGRAENTLQQQEINIEPPENPKNTEWKILKNLQRDERTQFFADGKSEFSDLRLAVYREIREEYRERWADYYSAKKDGADLETLKAFKAELVAEQKAALGERRDQACLELRADRDERYRDILDRQQEDRATLRDLQSQDLDNAPFLDRVAARGGDREAITASFHEAGREVTGTWREYEPTFGWSHEADGDGSYTIPAKDDGGVDIGRGVGLNLGSLLGAALTDLINLGSARPEPAPTRDETGRRFIDIAAEEATKHREQVQREVEDDERTRRQGRVYGE